MPSIQYKRKHVECLLIFSLLTMTVLSVIPVKFNLLVAASPETTVAVDPPVSTANPPPAPGSNQYFTINFNVTDVVDLFSWEVIMRWPIGFLEVDTANITEGPFLPQGGTTFFAEDVNPNSIILGATGYGMFTPVSGSGILANATCRVLKPGNVTLELFSTSLLNQTLDEMPHTPINGSVYTTFPVADFTLTPDPAQYPGRPIVGEMVTFNGSTSYDPDDPYESTPGGIISYEWNLGDGTTGTGEIVNHAFTEAGSYIVRLNVTDDDDETSEIEDTVLIQFHDIAVTNITVTPTLVAVGSTVTINATVVNRGSGAEHFNVTAYYIPVETPHIFSIDTQTRKSVPKDENATITFEWDTFGIAEGAYGIGVNASLVDQLTFVSRAGEEANLADNGILNGMVTVTKTISHDLAIANLQVSPTSVDVGQTSSIDLTIKNEGNVDEQFNATVTVYYDSDVFNTKLWSNQTLLAGTTTQLTFNWLTGSNTTEEGTYNVTAHLILVNATTLDFLLPYNASIPDDNPTDNAHSISPLPTIGVRPVASFTFSPTEIKVDQTVTFNSSSSYAPGVPGGAIVSYEWNFGDGTTVTLNSPIATHAYRANGTFTVTLTVTDDVSLTGDASEMLDVSPFHNVDISETTFSPHIVESGEQVNLNVTVNVRLFSENFNLTTFFDNNAISTQSNIDLQVGVPTAFTFTWDTTDVAGGDYTVKAVTTTLEETITYIAGVVRIEKLSSAITLAASPASLTVGDTVSLSGSLTPGQAGVGLMIEYRLSGEATWSTLTTVTTEAEGTYSYSWTPTTAGTFAVKSSWEGTNTLASNESEVIVVVVHEISPPSPFLYTTVGLAIAVVAVAFYFLRIKKPPSK
jgi:PKD repeat protein